MVAFVADAAERQVRPEFAPILGDGVLLRHDCGKLTLAIYAVSHGTVLRIDLESLAHESPDFFVP